MYDILAGKENMESSYVMSKGKALEAFPMLKQDGLVGALVYYDGQHNDSRMNMALIMTAVQQGATVANYVEVTELHKDTPGTGKLYGARVKDNLTGQEWDVRAKVEYQTDAQVVHIAYFLLFRELSTQLVLSPMLFSLWITLHTNQ